jgi:YfiH family protein
LPLEWARRKAGPMLVWRYLESLAVATIRPMPQISSESAKTQISANGVEWLGVPEWGGLDWLWHGFSTRRGGVSRTYLPDISGFDDLSGELNLGFTAADPAEDVHENRLRFIAAVTGSRSTPLVAVRQVHSDRSVVLRAPWVGFTADTIPEVDGIITDQPGLLLGIQTADCIPVLVADRARRAVAGFHAGWRGTVERIVELGIEQMRAEFGSDPGDLVAAIGPGIGACCYTVGDEVRNRFESRFSYAAELFSEGDAGHGSGLRLDLTEANRRQLMAAGLDAGSISVVGGCTGCQQELFFSHRASGGHAGRMMSVIGIR